MGLKQRPFEEVLKMVPLHADLVSGLLGHVGRALEQIADGLLPGGVALFLPELHLQGGAVQNHHLADGEEIVDGIGHPVHQHGGGLVFNGHGNGAGAEGGLELEPVGVTAGQELVYRPAARRLVPAHGHDPVPRPQPALLDTDAGQVLRRQSAVVGADGGVRQDHHVPRLQPTGAMGVGAAVEQAETLLGPLVDVGNDSLPVQGEDGVGGCV